MFENTKFISRSQVGSARYDARQWVEEDARMEIARAMSDHYGRDFPQAMMHIKRWREATEDCNIYPMPDDPPEYLPDLRFRLVAVVEGFDV